VKEKKRKGTHIVVRKEIVNVSQTGDRIINDVNKKKSTNYLI
jgi:hypothetical protein